MLKDSKERKRTFVLGRFVVVLLILQSVNCLAQEDLYEDELTALLKPINVSYFKQNGFKKLDIEYYNIQNSDTIFSGRKRYYTLENDEVLSEYKPYSPLSGADSKNKYKEDQYGYLYPVAADKKEFPSKYLVDQGHPVMRKSIYGKQYFFYDDAGRIIKTVSDTFYIAGNHPCSVIEFKYKGDLLVKKISSVFDAGMQKPISSDTLKYDYEKGNVLRGYSTSRYSTIGDRSVRIFRSNDGKTVDLVRTSKQELVRYKFE